MKKSLIALLSTTALVAAAGAVQAADVVRPVFAAPQAIAAPSLATWSGVYFGTNLGYASISGQIDDVNPNYATNAGFQNVKRANGFLLGGQIGYDWQLGPAFVLGVVGDVSGILSQDAICGAAGCVNGAGGGTANLDYNVKGVGSIAARFGFLLGQQTLLYGLAGFAEGAVTTNHHDNEQYDGSTRLFTGWTAGLGVEKMVTQHASLDLEGRYYNLGSKTWTDASSESFGAAPRLWTITVGAKYRF